MRTNIYFGVVFTIAACCLALPQTAAADAIPPASLYSAIQEGQDVKLEIELPDLGDGYTLLSEHPRSIVRVQGDDTYTVAENLVLADMTPVREGGVCGKYWYEYIERDLFCDTYPDACHSCDTDDATTCIGESCDDCTEIQESGFSPVDINKTSNFCESYPAYKVDCNGDGTEECCLVCSNNLYYEVWDICVPPGTTEYLFHDDSEWDDYTMSLVSEFEVVDAGMDCEIAAGDGGPDTETENAVDTETDISADTATDSPEVDTVDTETAVKDTETALPETDTETVDTDAAPSTDDTEKSEVDTATDNSAAEDTATENETTDTEKDTENTASAKSGGGCSVIRVGNAAPAQKWWNLLLFGSL